MNGTMEDFSREPAEFLAGTEFLAGKGEERRGEEEAFDTLQFYIGKDPSLLPYLLTT